MGTLKYYDTGTSQWVYVAQGVPGPGVPVGGTTNQILAKTSATDYATGWTSSPAVTYLRMSDTGYILGYNGGVEAFKILEFVNNGPTHGCIESAYGSAYVGAVSSGADAETNGDLKLFAKGTGTVQARQNGTTYAAVATTSHTQTLTNKRVQPRTGTTTSSATPTINTDNVDFYSLTAQAVDITSFTTNLTGTPVEAQKLWIAITGTAARAITWGTGFEAGAVALPTTTVLTTRLDVGFIWNTVTSKWRCMAAG